MPEPRPVHVLILEDQEGDAQLMLHELARAGIVPTALRAGTEREYLDLLGPDIDVILADYRLPSFDAIGALHLLQERELDIPFIVVSGSLSDEEAAACIKQGATDFLLKDRLARLGPAVEHALEQKALRAAQRRADAALRESEERYRLITETVRDAIFMADLDGRLIYANQAAEQLTGYTLAEFAGRPLSSLLSVDHARQASARLAAIQAGQEVPAWFEAELVRKDGTVIWAEAQTADMTKDGRVVGRIGVVRDITTRRRTDQELRLQNTALEAAANAILVTDRQGTIVRVNRAFSELTGYTAQEVLGRGTPRIFNSGRQDAAFYERLWATILSGQVWWGEVTNRRKDGRLYIEEQTITPVRNGNGEVTHFIAIKQDISARKASEEALSRSEASYRALVDNAPVGIFRSKADGTLLAVNPALATMLGYDSNAELLTRNLAEVYRSPAERVQAIECRRRGLFENFDVEWKRKDGTVMTVRTTGRALGDPGSPTEVFEVFVEDVTEQRRTDERLRQTDKLTTLGGLISGVAHELNNPLTVVLGFAHMLATQSDLPAAVTKKLALMKASTERATKIVKNLLTFARQQPPALTRVRLAELVDQVLQLLEYPLRANGVEVIRDFAAGTPDITADRDQLLQVALNIIQNAMQAMAGCKQKQIVSRIIPTNSGVRLEFQDTGPGIPPGLMARVFEPFFTTKSPGQGTGLGLSICYGIVTSHGGEIVAENVPGGGARFVIKLPVGAGPTGMSSDGPENVRQARSVAAARILAVDDEPEILDLLTEILGTFGHRVQAAATGQAALERIERGEHFDAIILDMKMPDMDGPALYRELAQGFPDASRRVIFNTGDVIGGDTDAFIKATGRPSLMKPCTPEELVGVVNAVLSGGQARPAATEQPVERSR
jgi:nitrogen fixation negative regulator NifL